MNYKTAILNHKTALIAAGTVVFGPTLQSFASDIYKDLKLPGTDIPFLLRIAPSASTSSVAAMTVVERK